MTLTHVDILVGLQNTLESRKVGAAKSTKFSYAFAVISNALKKLKENICISRASYTVPVIFMTLTHVDTFRGLKISLVSLKVGANKSTISCMPLPLFQMLLRN